MYTQKLPKETSSLCPKCVKKIPARVFEEDGKIWIEKTCPEHGKFREIYFADAGMYNKFRKFGYDGKGIENPNTESTGNCPFDCGLCNKHKSQTCLANIAVTNRCDLRCWYCFYFAKEGGNVYEPTLKQIRDMLKVGKAEKPNAPTAIQLTGGNPELRPDLVKIIEICKEEGYRHIQLNLQGTHRFWKDEKFVKDVRKAGVDTIYLSFDGVSKKANPKNHWEIPYIFKNLRTAGMCSVLVPTVIKGTNDHEVGSMVNFALNNMDIVRGVNFQPVSLVGRMPRKDREERRITIPEVIKNIEEQTRGAILKEDFYPVPVVGPITRFVNAMTGKSKYSLSCHFACGAATYLFMNGDKVVPITRFIDVEGFMEYLDKESEKIENGKNKLVVASKTLLNLGKFINKEKEPKNLNIAKLLFNALIKHDYKALRTIHYKSLFIGMMHFQDLYNYDCERVERCVIHYLMPDKKIIPFCTFNVLPDIYRDKMQNQFSIPTKEWEKKNNRKLKDDLYIRDVKSLENNEIYKNTYDNMKNFFG
ncbi:MAG: radical SAM protein [Candidatus Aenigmarchaeota archaeon]|nr:radical SAM protein [Candidatus Aenigmarchaeota archaeon]